MWNIEEIAPESGEDGLPQFRIPMRRASPRGSGNPRTSTRIFDESNRNDNSQTFGEFSRSLERSTQAWTLATIKLEPCKPAEGNTEISHYEFARWKDTLVSTLDAIPGVTERDKFNVFKRTAGTTC